MWARARDSALAFYERHGFTTAGLGYADLTTGLPHHDVVRMVSEISSTVAWRQPSRHVTRLV